MRLTSSLVLCSLVVFPVAAVAETAGDEAFPTNVSAATLSADAIAPTELPDGVLSGRPWHVDFTPPALAATPGVAKAAAYATGAAANAASQQRRAVAITYSDAYYTRAKIHKYASFATLPLFVTEYILGQKLYDFEGSESVRAAHAGVATTLAVLFGVNTVTGAWNLWEGRKDPNHRSRRMLHGFMMLGADAGFLAVGALAPDNEGGGNREAHKAMAITSMGVATASYLIMLFGN